MSWVNGWYFSKAEDERLIKFLKGQGLTEEQAYAVSEHNKQSLTAKLNLWVVIGGIPAFLAGIVLTKAFSLSGCFLF